MKVFLTGATGFIGHAVGRRLVAGGRQVSALCRSADSAARAAAAGFDVLRGDLTQTQQLTEWAAAADAVIHTAFGHDGSWIQAVEEEVAAVTAFGAGLRDTGRALIVASGGGVLGDTRATGPVGPDYAGDPQSALAPRRRVDTLCRELFSQGVRTATLRLPLLVFGSGGGVLVPPLLNTAKAVGAGLYVGDGENRLSKIHIDDAAAAFERALSNDSISGVWHISDGKSVSGRELAEAIAHRAGVDATRSITFEEAKVRLGPVLATLISMWNELDSAATIQGFDWHPKATPNLAQAL